LIECDDHTVSHDILEHPFPSAGGSLAGALPASILRFGDFELDCGRFELRRNGDALRLEPKPMELLILLASREGQLVLRTEIAERLWSREVFVDTEHGINTAIRKLRGLFGDDPDDPHFIQTVPGMGYRFIAPIRIAGGALPGTNPAASSEPDQVDAHAASPVASSANAPRFWVVMTVCAAILIAILTLAIGPYPLAARLLHRNAAPVINSLAVLPLDNLTGDPNQEYFADGMTDELITMLAKDSTLRITSRTSVMQYKGVHKPLPEIARVLNVDAVLEGSVSRSLHEVHLSLQLIRADTDTHLWADSYDRDQNDAAQLPSEAAHQIANYLHKTSSTPATAGFVNPDAHDAYLRGRYLWFRYQNEEAGKYFRKATELQPDSALAWTGLASYFGLGAIGGYQDPRISVPQLKTAALRAAQLDDSLPEAHLSLGAAYLCEWNIKGAQSETDRAIQLNPSLAEAYHLLARIDTAINRNAQAIEFQRKAMELDPFERPWGMVWTLKTARQFDAAIQEGRQRLQGFPNDDALYWELGQVYERAGQRDKAVQAWVKMELAEGHTSNAAIIGEVYRRNGWSALIKRFIAEDEKESAKSYVSPFDLARYHAQLSEREQTISLLGEAYRERSPQLLWIQTDPAFDFLHSDRRYRGLVQQIGLPPAY
jgi:TolB-like protein/DNA-binding winged helix-turn-helix (wHTH) protein